MNRHKIRPGNVSFWKSALRFFLLDLRMSFKFLSYFLTSIDRLRWHSAQKAPSNLQSVAMNGVPISALKATVLHTGKKTNLLFFFVYLVRILGKIRYGECLKKYWACVVSQKVLQFTPNLNCILGAVIPTYMYRVPVTVMASEDGVLPASVRILNLGACHAHVWYFVHKENHGDVWVQCQAVGRLCFC